MKKHRHILLILMLLALFGVYVSGYLTYEHYSNAVPYCPINPIIDCGRVLKSEYAIIFGVPLAFWGVVYYLGQLGVIVFHYRAKSKQLRRATLNLILLTGIVGAFTSAYLVYLQVFVIYAICIYCMASAINTFVMALIELCSYYHYED